MHSLIRAFASHFVKLLTEQYLDLLSLKGGSYMNVSAQSDETCLNDHTFLSVNFNIRDFFLNKHSINFVWLNQVQLD